MKERRRAGKVACDGPLPTLPRMRGRGPDSRDFAHAVKLARGGQRGQRCMVTSC
jgi:hypothetical protein